MGSETYVRIRTSHFGKSVFDETLVLVNEPLLAPIVVSVYVKRRTFVLTSAVGLLGVSAGCISDVREIATEAEETEKTVSTTPTTRNETTGQGKQTKSDYGSRTVEDLKIYNETDEQLTVTVTITRIPEDVPHRENAESSEQSKQRDLSSQPTLVSETFELSPSSGRQNKKVYADPITTRDTYEIKIDVRDGPTATYDWTDEYDDALGVLVYVETTDITFTSIES